MSTVSTVESFYLTALMHLCTVLNICIHAVYIVLGFYVACMHLVATLCLSRICSIMIVEPFSLSPCTVSTVYGGNDNNAHLT